MNKWSEIKQATLDKLFLTIDEADDQGYLSKFRYLANECLNIIANGVKPRIAELKVVVIEDFKKYTNVIYGSNFKYDSELGFVIYDQNGISAERVPETTDLYVSDIGIQYILRDEKLVAVSGKTITMPNDFLSFADMIIYHDGEPCDDFVYLGDFQIGVHELGEYVINYNALWNQITNEDIDTDKRLTTHVSVINCLPTYIASQCLSQDDVQRSAILKNEFELMLSRLDTNIMNQNNSYRSSGGWY